MYSSNRGENTLAVFAVNDDLTLSHIQSITTAGDFPRDFELSQDETFLVASNQNGDNLTLYARDTTTGQLTLLQQEMCIRDRFSTVRPVVNLQFVFGWEHWFFVDQFKVGLGVRWNNRQARR